MKMIALFIILLSVSCGKMESTRKSSAEKQNVSPIYSSSQVNIKVYYETGAEPYTDNVGALNMSLWDMFQVNMEALFEGRSTVITVPKTLNDMIKLKDYNKSTWSVEDVQKMANDYPVTASTGMTNFQIFFVNGYASHGSSIIGFHISNTKIMVLFKEVIKSSASGSLSMVPKYVEQATLIHEMGHALGLVNNGLPMQKDHQDTPNGAHCSNENCVMYYANEGAGSLKKYIDKVIAEKRLIMFDQQCLNDALNYQK